MGYGIYSSGTTTGNIIMNDGAVITVKMEQGSAYSNLSALGVSNGADIDIVLGDSVIDADPTFVQVADNIICFDILSNDNAIGIIDITSFGYGRLGYKVYAIDVSFKIGTRS